MQLKTLTINGFKSFADKTLIEFVPGLTGIVGPNGSGKSNITEAIRWALGEQSAKSLRGERMGDVIFAGTADRAPLNRAEVILTFDNTDGYLPKQPQTVTVTRRLYRDGETDFLLNGQNVRLRDIVELFMDSGLGKESFAFISQGRVEAIFNSKPEERRGIIEEVAGVYKYKQQKQRAEAELGATADNLDRVSDIVTELTRQVEPLREQASVATDYLQQSEAFAQIEQTVLALEIRDLAAEQRELDQKTSQTKRQLAALADKISTLETQSDAMTQQDQAIEQQLTAANDDILSQSMQLENLTGEVNLSSERSQNAAQSLAELTAQHEAAVQAAKDAKAKLEALEHKQQTLTDQVADLQAQLDQAKLATDPKAINNKLEATQANYIDLLRQEADIRNQRVAVDKEQALAHNQSEAYSQRLHEQGKQLEQQKQRQKTLTADLTNAKTNLTAAQKAASDINARAVAKQEAVDAANQQYQQALGIYQTAKSRYDTLKELREDYAGFYAGVRMVLKQKNQLPGVIGAVADLVTVPEQYQTAFDLAIGGSLQSIVTTDQQAAKRAINYLKQQRGGRATFLPEATIRPRTMPANVAANLAQQPGFVGIGIDLVNFPQEVANVMGSLLGTLIVVDTLDHAIAAADATGHRYKLVTLDGDILNPGGSMSGGQNKQQSSSPLARTQETNRLAKQLQTMVTQLETKRNDVTELITQANKLQAQTQDANQAAMQAQSTFELKQQQVDELNQSLTQLQRQYQALQLQDQAATDLSTRQEELERAAAAVKQQLAESQAATDELKALLASATEQQTALTEQRRQLQAQLSETQGDLKVAVTERNQTQAQFDQALRQADELAERIQQIQQHVKETTDQKQSRKAAISELNKTLAKAKDLQNQLLANRSNNRTQLSRVSAQITTAYQQQHELMATSEQQAVAQNRIKLQLESRLSTLADTYQLTYEAALDQVEDPSVALPPLKSQLKLLKRGLDDLGPVNVNAIDQYAEVKDRYEFLTKQQDDLIAAKNQLQGTMAELDKEVMQRFKTTFDATNMAFQDLFPQMFGGGHASLSLTDPSDLLNTGIEITAQPPGKKLQRLSLLSGGERALTAIGLLFAILQVKPVPFSILDEVEASLDETNVERFGQFLRDYASATQFIVITHRKGTMVAANMLYGVTMQESGVSKMMAVSLDREENV
ncbi:chromosome segregation protein SMC [Lacticaseibacillus brantae]|uniref:Chromosome partition protein Smc n=1 Tax=Lacticaseibacillus brantae DSM 23927 TaxID=1423727 RepID=A0A0R2B9F9_9LACO|nr:chromosome segregation protein SMC [Lacticaseibacillus brantae]KRM72790.1 chromosome segregation protein SMC [Lacticaseibacillus brantae DSM 23927]